MLDQNKKYSNTTCVMIAMSYAYPRQELFKFYDDNNYSNTNCMLIPMAIYLLRIRVMLIAHIVCLYQCPMLAKGKIHILPTAPAFFWPLEA